LEATTSQTIIKTIIEPAQITNILAVFGGLNIFIWLFKAGMIYANWKNKKGGK